MPRKPEVGSTLIERPWTTPSGADRMSSAAIFVSGQARGCSGLSWRETQRAPTGRGARLSRRISARWRYPALETRARMARKSRPRRPTIEHHNIGHALARPW